MTKRLVLKSLRVAVVLGLGAAVLMVAGYLARQRAIDDVRENAETSFELHAALVRNNLDRYRSLPFVLARDLDIRKALATRDPSALAYLNQKLEAMAIGIRAPIIYVLDNQGNAIAASNWREPATLVGTNYQFRPYYTDATADGHGEYFALGSISHLPGLYVSHRIDHTGLGSHSGASQSTDGTRTAHGGTTQVTNPIPLLHASQAPLGVVVVKVEFQWLEADWRHHHEPVFITDSNGVVLLSSQPDWRFRTLAPLPDGVKLALRTSLQFGDAQLTPLPMEPDQDSQVRLPIGTDPNERYLHVQKPVQTVSGWHLHVLAPVGKTSMRAAYSAQISTLPAVMLLAGAWTVWRQRHRRRVLRERERAQMLDHLETQVGERTRELASSNVQLAHEIEERERTEQRAHRLQDELAQASKLSLLGQITAGVAHEINQPVAAIRSYAENASLLLARDRREEAEANMQAITSLTERIGHITGDLRQFAKRRVDSDHNLRADVAAAVESALLLLGARQRSGGIAVHIDISRPLTAAIEPLRLEQILINVLQNAMDALPDIKEPTIWLSAQAHATMPATLEIIVRDNGPGMDANRREALFTPFSTGKPDGLGLGLVISRELARDAQGELDTAPIDTGGAVFVLTLPIA